jgi:hypothetical protein
MNSTQPSRLMLRLEAFRSSSVTTAIMAMVLLYVKPLSVSAAEGVSSAQAALAKAKAALTDDDWLHLSQEVQTQVMSLPQPERIEFLCTLAKGIASQAQSPERERTAEAAIFVMGASGTTREEKAQAFSRLFTTCVPENEATAERLLTDIEVMQMPNGEKYRDFSVYRLALEEGTGATQGRLIKYLLLRSPLDAGSWLVENIELPETERTMLRTELNQARQIEGSASAPWERTGSPAMNNQDREQKLRQWAASPSWILQLLAKSLLEKYPTWQTPDLEDAAQRAAVPESVTLLSVNSARRPLVSNPPLRAVHAVSSTASKVPTTHVFPVVLRSAAWPWIVVILILLAIVSVALNRRM